MKQHKALKKIFTLALAPLLLICALFSQASTNLNLHNSKNTLTANNAPALIPPPPALSAKGFVLMEGSTGKILASKAMNQRMQPASLTKLMTLYLTFQALDSKQISLADQVHISKKAWRMGGSRMFLQEGSHTTVKKLIQGVIVASGNDACVALAEYIAGNEATFAKLMNQTAAQLKMTHSNFVDSTGMPNRNHYTTPHDIAVLSYALINNFPQYYHFFDEKWIKYNNIKQPNRNRLLWRDPSVDGLKTGHTDAAGYCLVSSGKRNGMRLISVVMGTPTDSARAKNSQALLNYGFRFYKTYKLFDSDQAVANPRVWMGKQKNVALGLIKPLYINIPVAEYKNLKAAINLDDRLTAPIERGQSYGTINVTLRGEVLTSAPLVALERDPKGSLFSRISDHVTLFIKG